MPSLDDVARAYTDLDRDDLEWLHWLVSDWQVIADLSFADLVLWLPDRNGNGYWGAAQMRPTTGPTAFVEDQVGGFVPKGRRMLLDVAYGEGRIAREGDPEWRDEVPVRVEAIPVVRDARMLGVIARNTNLLGVRTPSRLELSYLQTAADLTLMISEGRFPYPVARRDWSSSPRVGDGFIRLDAAGVVTYASPNALSAYRRLGLTADLVNESLGGVTQQLAPPSAERPIEESTTVTLSGREPREAEVGDGEVTIVARVIPLCPGGQHEGALVLLRDVTELRSRERELITKDATIREIHHRVKNNLQTVAALLRLQARRMGVPEARLALDEAVGRVGSIALVHETLSQTFDERVEFDTVADRLQQMVAEVSTGCEVTATREGSFGQLPAEVATPLAMVLTEILQNAVEHGLAGRAGVVGMRVLRAAGRLEVTVDDDGVGLPAGFDAGSSASLGLSIVRTLVESELGGLISFGRSASGGARVDLDLPLSG